MPVHEGAVAHRPSINERAQSLFERLDAAVGAFGVQADRLGGAYPEVAEKDGRSLNNDSVSSLLDACHWRMDDLEAQLRRIQNT